MGTPNLVPRKDPVAFTLSTLSHSSSDVSVIEALETIPALLIRISNPDYFDNACAYAASHSDSLVTSKWR